jgi:hypothetical protein
MRSHREPQGRARFQRPYDARRVHASSIQPGVARDGCWTDRPSKFSPFFLAPTDFGSAGTRVQACNIWEEGIDLLSLPKKERAGAEQEAAMPLIIGAKHVDPFLSSLLFASYNRSRICMARWGPSLAAGRTRMKIRFFPHSYSHLTDHVYALPVWRSSVWLRPDVHA